MVCLSVHTVTLRALAKGLSTVQADTRVDLRIFCYRLLVVSFHATPLLYRKQSSGSSCSKLTTSLVNVSLKFQTLISKKK